MIIYGFDARKSKHPTLLKFIPVDDRINIIPWACKISLELVGRLIIVPLEEQMCVYVKVRFPLEEI